MIQVRSPATPSQKMETWTSMELMCFKYCRQFLWENITRSWGRELVKIEDQTDEKKNRRILSVMISNGPAQFYIFLIMEQNISTGRLKRAGMFHRIIVGSHSWSVSFVICFPCQSNSSKLPQGSALSLRRGQQCFRWHSSRASRRQHIEAMIALRNTPTFLGSRDWGVHRAFQEQLKKGFMDYELVDSLPLFHCSAARPSFLQVC